LKKIRKEVKSMPQKCDGITILLGRITSIIIATSLIFAIFMCAIPLRVTAQKKSEETKKLKQVKIKARSHDFLDHKKVHNKILKRKKTGSQVKKTL